MTGDKISKRRLPKSPHHYEKDVVDRMAKRLREVGTPVLEPVAQAEGLNPRHVKSILIRGEAEDADPRDRYLCQELSKALADVELGLLAEWKRGNQGVERLMSLFYKRYNHKYVEELNSEISHILQIVADNVDQDTMFRIMDDLIEYEPDLVKEGVNLRMPGMSIAGALPSTTTEVEDD